MANARCKSAEVMISNQDTILLYKYYRGTSPCSMAKREERTLYLYEQDDPRAGSAPKTQCWLGLKGSDVVACTVHKGYCLP